MTDGIRIETSNPVNKQNTASYTVNAETITLQNPQRGLFVFGDWYTDIALTQRKYTIDKSSAGNVTLYAKWLFNNGTPVDTKVKVTYGAVPVNELVMPIGTFYQMSVTTEPANVKWSSEISDTSVIVKRGYDNQFGALKVGSAVVTFTAEDGSGAQAKFKIKVVNEKPIIKVIPAKNEITLVEGEEYKIECSVKPAARFLEPHAAATWEWAKKVLYRTASSI